MSAGVDNIKLRDEMLLSECRCPGRFIVSCFFRRLVKRLGKLLELIVGQFWFSSGCFVVVERVFEAALFEAI